MYLMILDVHYNWWEQIIVCSRCTRAYVSHSWLHSETFNCPTTAEIAREGPGEIKPEQVVYRVPNPFASKHDISPVDCVCIECDGVDCVVGTLCYQSLMYSYIYGNLVCENMK